MTLAGLLAEPPPDPSSDAAEEAEDALAHAATAWRAARDKLERVNPAALRPAARDGYFRLLVRIGLWVDARTLEHAPHDDDPDAPESEPD